MPPLDREAFRRLVGRLDRETFARFVAALWRGRGYETVVDGDVVVARRGDVSVRVRPVVGRWSGRRWVSRRWGRLGRLRQPRPPRSLDADADVDVVAFAGVWSGASPAAARVVDVDDLYEVLLYALPRATAEAVCRRFFDRPLARPDDESDGRPAGRAPSSVASARESVPAVVLAVVALVLAGALVTGTGLLSDGGFGGDTTDFGAPASDAGGGSLADASTPTSTPPPGSPSVTDARPTGALNRSVDGEYPPGLGPAGVVDADRLARAHAQAATGRSYRLTLVHREFVDGRPNGYRRERVAVASPTVYASSVESVGRLTRPSLVVANAEAFSGGGVRYERRLEPNGSAAYETATVRTTRADAGRYADRVGTYVRWFLSVEESAVRDAFERDGVTYYWVVLGADPYPGVRNSTGSALVSETGFVYGIHRRYEVPNRPNVTVAVSVRYDDVGRTRVSAPPWVDEARAATDGSRVGAANETDESGGETDERMETATAENGTDETTPVPSHGTETAGDG